MADVEVFQAGLDDCTAVMDVMHDAFDPAFGEAWSLDQLRSILILPGSYLFISRIGNTVSGFALARAILDESELMLLAVSRDFRGLGHGIGLVEKVIAESRRRNVKHIFLEMRDDNVPALTLYKEAGFVPVGKRPGYYRGNDGILRDAITMSLSIE